MHPPSLHPQDARKRCTTLHAHRRYSPTPSIAHSSKLTAGLAVQSAVHVVPLSRQCPPVHIRKQLKAHGRWAHCNPTHPGSESDSDVGEDSTLLQPQEFTGAAVSMLPPGASGACAHVVTRTRASKGRLHHRNPQFHPTKADEATLDEHKFDVQKQWDVVAEEVSHLHTTTTAPAEW